MDSGRQVVRWALPGWVCIMFWTGFICIEALLHGHNQPLYLNLLREMKNSILPLGIASIPLGFVLYQVYYWVYWYLPFPSITNPISQRKVIDPIDRGQEILKDVKGEVDFEVLFKDTLRETPPTPFIKRGIFYVKSRIISISGGKDQEALNALQREDTRVN